MEDEISIGEYVRINNDFRLIALGVGKVINIVQDTIYVKLTFEMPFSFKKESIVKHSKDIIDLVCEGDYVNGVRILDITGDYIHTAEWDCFKERLRKKLKSIITKEQIKQIEFRIKE